MKRFILFFPLFPATAWADDASAYNGSEIVVTATRFAQKIQDQPVDVAVITQDMIGKSPAATLPELLSELAGIRTRNVDGSQDQQIDLRGFGMTGNQNTTVLLDGMPLNDIELTSVRWSSIPLASIDKIEVLRGAGAVLYGGGTTGGVINIITKKPQAGKESGGVAFYDGSYATHELRGD
ncbi:MAG: TonB-dependent receptor plug domain-containing protein, partial [Burkholderiales bacterium]